MEEATIETTDFQVDGMSCDGCTAAVEKAVTDLDGVSSCSVSLATSKVRVLFDAAMVTPRRILEKIRQSGYEAKMLG